MAQAAVCDDRTRFLLQQACCALGIKDAEAFEDDPATLELVASFLNGAGPQSLMVYFAKEEAPPPEPVVEPAPEELPPPSEPEPVEAAPAEAPAEAPAPEAMTEEGEAPKASECSRMRIDEMRRVCS